MTRPLIQIVDADGNIDEREMTDEEIERYSIPEATPK